MPGLERETPDDADLIDIADFQPGRSLLGKAAARVRRWLPAADFDDAKFAMIVELAVRAALARFPIELLEIEEAFGLASRIIKLKRIPVVTRLQGPWFLNGEVLGEKKDAAFLQRVEQERLSIAWADGITSPSQDILDRTRDYYSLPLEGARVIPCPIDPRPEDRPWKLADADPNRILFVGRFDLHKGADLMIDAFGWLAPSRPSLYLDFVGPDRGIPDPSKGRIGVVDYIKSRISDSSVADRIVIHGQKRPDEIDDFRRVRRSRSSLLDMRLLDTQPSRPCGWVARSSRPIREVWAKSCATARRDCYFRLAIRRTACQPD